MTILLIAGVAILGWAVFTFNRLIRLRQLGDNAWADIDVQLKRRHDLIPQVVAVVQGHAGYERGTLEAVVAARGRALQATGSSPATRAKEEVPLGGALQRLVAVAEAYPELRAAASFANLQTTLVDVEEHLQNARRYYNAVVRDFNTAIAQFPSGIIAGMMRIQPREFFGLDDPSERAVPRVAPLLLLLALSATSLAAQQKSYWIERFDARITVNRDRAIDVTETITAHFVGSWNGLYRTIPVEYRTRQGLNWTLGVQLVSVQDDAGRPLRTETSRESYYVKYKVWIPNAANANRTIVLRYRATNGLRFFDEHDELYWNVTGDEWSVPIKTATAEVVLPPDAPGVRAIAFNGVYGSTAQDAKVDIQGSVIRFTMPHPLAYHEGMTVVVGWDKGVIPEPTLTDRLLATALSNWPLLIPIPVFLLAFLVWRRRGRDPAERPVAVQYEPPQGVTPAEAGTLLDNTVDMRDITSTVVDLAVRGVLKIEEHELPKILGIFGGGATYMLQRVGSADGLAWHERRIFDGIFLGRGIRVSFDELEMHFYEKLPGIRDAIIDSLKERGFYRDRPDKVRITWRVLALVAGGLIFAAGMMTSQLFLLTPVSFIIAAIVVTIMLLIFAEIMPARTEAGARAWEQIRGFEEFLRRVETEAYKRVIINRPELFDKFLPYAMAFGVEKQFTRAFDGIFKEAPQWYVGPSMTNFSVGHFSSSLSHMTSAVGTSMQTMPRSSSGSGFGGSGGGGGGGGGGSSGGGGGGGGGGAF